MTEISERHVEWATVSRMREMLPSVRRDFEVTQTYTLFTGILCWTIQRLRWRQDTTEIATSMSDLRARLERIPFLEFAPRLRPRPAPARSPDDIPFNDLFAFNQTGKHNDALSVLVSLRNAVAHGDARRVSPLNKGGRLIGYRLECQSENRDWRVPVSLNATGMSIIAGELARQYCEAAIHPDDRQNIVEAQRLREAG